VRRRAARGAVRARRADADGRELRHGARQARRRARRGEEREEEQEGVDGDARDAAKQPKKSLFFSWQKRALSVVTASSNLVSGT
jgi:hypothetical protein